MRILVLLTIFAPGIILTGASATKAIELSDRFLELKGDSTWVIMFYAPWCGHCKKLEPVWNHVAQALYNTEIRTGKVDCTRFTGLATHFKIKGFPTVMFIKGDFSEIYRGERTRSEIVGFALRMSAAPVPHLNASNFKLKLVVHHLMFVYAGSREGELWDSYYSQVLSYRHFHFFYSVDPDCLETVTELDSNPAVVVYKDKAFTFYPVPDVETYRNVTALNESLARWINNERFPLFMKITHGNLPQLWKMNKYLCILVLEENKIGNLKGHEENEKAGDGDAEENNFDVYKFKDMVENVIRNKRSKYNSHFQFGWTGTPDLANSIVMARLSLPAVIIVDAMSMNHFLPEIPSHQLDENSLEQFFDSVLNQSATPYGGNTYPLRVYRAFYNTKTAVEEMWLGNPVLTAVLFGLPFGFLSLICYSIWCSDILDADEETEETASPNKMTEKDGLHEKKE